MIKNPGPADASYGQLLDQIAVDALPEYTDDGFEYQVFDPDRMPGGRDLILGTVVSKPDEVEVDLYVSAAIPSDIRPALATICAESSPFNDRYALARIADTALGMNEVASNEAARTYNSRVLRHISANMRLHMQAVQNEAKSNYKVHPQAKDTLRSTIGWVAFRRELSPVGTETFERLTKDGLWIPQFETEQRVAGLLSTKKGDKIRAGFMSMTEKSEHHSCASCSGQILKGTSRITMQTDGNRQYSDHHHYHGSCFVDNVLPKFEVNSLTVEPNSHALG